ncbi:conjugal transfer protein TraX [Schnuerera sp. xch1]|uniref:TraX family protein n=1 Tax=Schnuerera sp. xch1 TaxID=2874283 RepID=UPI001CC1740D|nr:TraX family protein [Schnuerera sp. xch1]MBZ2174528.1 conjugal transfer protein TraX [Schnuerera sp. xch1]
MNVQIFNAFSLKIIMIILMAIDHIGQFIPGIPPWFRWIGRIVAPIFFFLLAEGYDHSRNKIAYLKRLFKAGIIMFIGNTILWFIFKNESFISNNIFLTLAINLAILILLDQKEGKNKLLLIALIIFAALTEGSLLSTAVIIIFHYLKDKKLIMSIAYIMVSLLLIPNIQWMQVFALPFILMYNGERGPNIKKFFYIFYPVHIWILFIIGSYMSI